jgi:uncharacterized protein (TIGR02001 family)
MKKLALAAALAATFATPMLAQAADAKSDWTFAGNAGLVSDYRFRGFAQTDYKPAFQGGFDLSHASGFYLGNWNSNVEQSLYTGASLEMDFYGGYKGSIGDFGYDVGYIYYYYPNSGLDGALKIKNGELYVGGSYGPISLKVYDATTDFFSAPDTKNSYYVDLSAAYDLGEGLGINGHVGYQDVKNYDKVTDYKVGVTYDVAKSGWILGASVIATSKTDFFLTGSGDEGGKTKLVVSVNKSF